LGRKLDGGTISVFSHSTGTFCGKKKNKNEAHRAKNKNLKPHETKRYLTFFYNCENKVGIANSFLRNFVIAINIYIYIYIYINTMTFL
jgi:hypothetical protein